MNSWWARGLFVGEGSLLLRKPRRKAGQTILYRQPVATLNMTDRDAVEEFGRQVGVGKVTGPHAEHHERHKPYYRWQVTGFEGVQQAVAFLWPGLNARRREQASGVLLGFRATGARRRGRWERR